MRTTAGALIVAASVVAVIGSARSAEMTGPEIKAFLSGRTVYLETTAVSVTGKAGQGVIYWAEDGTGFYKTPTGTLWHGTFTIKGNSFCAVWKESPNSSCTRYDKNGDVVTIIDAKSGKVRAKIVKTAPGNAEKLGP
jgi:hypothetical protein